MLLGFRYIILIAIIYIRYTLHSLLILVLIMTDFKLLCIFTLFLFGVFVSLSICRLQGLFFINPTQVIVQRFGKETNSFCNDNSFISDNNSFTQSHTNSKLFSFDAKFFSLSHFSQNNTNLITFSFYIFFKTIQYYHKMRHH